MLKAAYESADKMKPIWQKVSDFCVSKKKNIKVLWNDADTQKNGLLNEGIVCAQTWDGPPIALKNDGQPVMYRAPKEGAMAWVDGMSLPIAAKNIEQAYAFLDYDYTPEPAGKAIEKHGYNSPVIGADKFAGDKYAKNFADALPRGCAFEAQPLAGRAGMVHRSQGAICQQVRERQLSFALALRGLFRFGGLIVPEQGRWGRDERGSSASSSEI